MINYTERLTLLMHDVVRRVPTLSFIDVRDVLVFARHGRSSAEGAFATCHCLSLPPSEPGYYFWRDRDTGKITRRSEWFVTKSPTVTIGHAPDQIPDLVRAAAVLRSVARPLAERAVLPRASHEPWMAKLDTVIHELYHIAPDLHGIRRIELARRHVLGQLPRPHFFSEVAGMVRTYLATPPDPAVYEFLRHDFAGLEAQFTAASSAPRSARSPRTRSASSSPSRCSRRSRSISRRRGRAGSPARGMPQRYTEDDLHVRHFTRDTSRRLVRKGAFRAA